MSTSLCRMKIGEEGVVVDIEGGLGAIERIRNMGIRVGKKVKKTTGATGIGPQTITVGHSTVAIGFGMAEKIIVEKIK